MLKQDLQTNVISLHTDPQHGSAFWLERLKRHGVRPEDILEDRWALPPVTRDELQGHPIEHFMPRSLVEERPPMITTDTSGFSGTPVTTAFLEAEFEAGFVLPFIEQAQRAGFPLNCGWLWAGPSGPHVIGKAIRAILAHVGGVDPFAVDFDPRWFRRLPKGSMSARRYLEHVLGQVLRVLEEQSIEILFTTPPVVEALAERLSAEQRSRYRGVHYGGMGMTVAQYRRYRQAFPNAVHMSGYGNSLFGMFPETGRSEDGIAYDAVSERVELSVVKRTAERWTECAPGEEGYVMLSRFDTSCLILNMIQEDKATRTANGIVNPRRDARELTGRLLY